MIFRICFLICLVETGYSTRTSLGLKVSHSPDDYKVLYETDKGRVFCYPTEEVMTQINSGSEFHNWGYNTWNYSTALHRVGQVLCRQLQYSFLESINYINENVREHKILWGASCLGYESAISHCLYEEFEDNDYVCPRVVGLKCRHCNKDFEIRYGEELKIESPGFPHYYTDSIICKWTFSSDINTVFVITLDNFSLPRTDEYGDCSVGSLSFEVKSPESPESFYTLREELCGTVKMKTFRFNGSSLRIRLTSGLFHPRPLENPGFSLKVKSHYDNVNVEELKKKMDWTVVISAVIGIVASTFILLLIIIFAKRQHEKFGRRKRRREMASTMELRSVNLDQQIPKNQFSKANVTLPFTQTPILENWSRKISLTSNTYEEIFESSDLHCSYLNLEDVTGRVSSPEKRKEHSVSSTTEPNNSRLMIPTLHISPPSYPSELDEFSPCPSSVLSELDSVFESDRSLDEEKPQNKERLYTYTISPHKQSGLTNNEMKLKGTEDVRKTSNEEEEVSFPMSEKEVCAKFNSGSFDTSSLF